MTPQQRLRADYLKVFDNEHGRKVLRNLMHRCYFTQPTIHPDPLQMAFNEGRRFVVLDILSIMQDEVNVEKVMAAQEQAYKDYNPLDEDR